VSSHGVRRFNVSALSIEIAGMLVLVQAIGPIRMLAKETRQAAGEHQGCCNVIACAMILLNSRTSISTNASHSQFDDAGPGQEPRYGYALEVNVAPRPVRVVAVPAPRMG
jgi:hypothetical protein